MSELTKKLSIIIRLATEQDYKPVLGLFDEIDEMHRLQHPQIFRKPDGPARELEYFQGILNDQNAAFFVAECLEELIGFVFVYVKDTSPIPIKVSHRFALVETLVVKSGYKHLGVGRLLMQTSEDWAKKRGAISVELSVYEFNLTAISFYEKIGYKTLSRRMRKELYS